MLSAAEDATAAGPRRGTATAVRPRPPSDDRRWRAVESRIRRLGGRSDGLIEVLHAVQDAFGFLDLDALTYVSGALHIPPSRVYGVATFYSYFTLKPAGEHTCVVCTGTACYINGAPGILAALRERLSVGPGSTTADGRVSVLTARCVGACSLAPVVVLDGEPAGRLTPAGVVALVEALPATGHE